MTTAVYVIRGLIVMALGGMLVRSSDGKGAWPIHVKSVSFRIPKVAALLLGCVLVLRGALMICYGVVQP
jgi:cbb3-type cytochrome oxidase subunit 1